MKYLLILLLLFSSCLPKENLNVRLLDAAEKGDLSNIKICLGKGANVNTRKKNILITPLMLAANKGYVEIVDTLLSHGADIHMKDAQRRTALMWAAWGGNKDIVRKILDAGAFVNERSSTMMTALAFAEKEGHQEVVELLKKAGADDLAGDE